MGESVISVSKISKVTVTLMVTYLIDPRIAGIVNIIGSIFHYEGELFELTMPLEADKVSLFTQVCAYLRQSS